MKLRRIVAVLLVAVLFFSVIPKNMPVSAENGAEMTEILVSEASAWGYQNSSGDKGRDAKGQHQTYEDLEQGLDKSLYGSNTQTSYVQYAVEAPADGEYKIEVGILIGTNTWDGEGQYLTKDDILNAPYIAVLVNENIYKAVLPKDQVPSTETQGIPLTVSLKKGLNLIRCTAMPPGQNLYDSTKSQGYLYCDQNYLKIDSRLSKASNGQNWYKAGANAVLNKYWKEDNTDYALGYGVENIRERYTIQGLNVENISNCYYIAMKVHAPLDGYYDLTLYTNGWFNKGGEATQIGMLVDGRKSVVKVNTSPNDNDEYEYADASCYLSAGDHIVIFTQPLPETEEQADEFYAKEERWLNYREIALGNGLTLVSGLTKEEAEDSVGGYIHIQAEDAVLRGYQNKGTYAGEASTKAQHQTYEELRAYLDKNDNNKGEAVETSTSYVQYAVEAPEDGEYRIKVGVSTGGQDTSSLTEAPYIGVLVNQKLYKGEIPKDQVGTSWNSITYGIPLTVTLKKGLNLIRCTALLKGQEAYELDKNGTTVWCDHDYLAIDRQLDSAPKGETTVAATDGAYAVSNLYFSTDNDTLGDASYATAARNHFSVADVSADTLRYIPHFSVKVKAPADGYYDITVRGGTDPAKSFIAMVVDGQASAKKIATNNWWQSVIDASCYLTAGNHILTFTLPLPQDSKEAAAFSYTWMNYNSVTLGNGLKAVSGLSAEEVLPGGELEGTRLEAENMQWNGYQKAEDFAGASGGKVVGGAATGPRGQELAELKDCLDKSSTSYVQYVVEAPEDGTYDVGLGFLVGESGSGDKISENPYSAVIVNDSQVYQAFFRGNLGEVYEAPLRISLKKGRNVIRCSGLTKDQQAWQLHVGEGDSYYWLNHDYLTVASGLTAVNAQGQTINAGDENFTVFGNYTRQQDGTLGEAVYDLAGRNKYTVLDVTPQTLRKIPYVALKVKAPADGYYDITVRGGTDPAKEAIAMTVDGKAESRKIFTNDWWESVVDASCYLTAGEHILAFTIPLPETSREAENYSYTWMNYSAITLEGGLCAVSGLTEKEVVSMGMEGSRMEAEDVQWNGYQTVEEFSAASGGKMVGGAATGPRGQTIEELGQGLDKAWTSYVQYVVDAPEDGEYTLAVGFLVGSTNWDNMTEIPYSAVLVNDQVYRAVYQGDYGNIGESVIRVTLKKGRNVIRCSGLTKDQQAWQLHVGEGDTYCWLNHDYLTLDSRLTAVHTTGQTVAAGDDAYTVFHNYSKNEDGFLGSAAFDTAARNKLSMADVTPENLRYISYVAYKVKAPKDGYYDITMNCSTEERPEGTAVAMILDGVVQKRQIAQNGVDGRIDATCYLTAGEHILVFTLPLPEAQWQAESYNYTWMDYKTIVLSGGLTAVKGLKKSDVMEIIEIDGLRIEAEDAVWNGYSAREELAEASGGAVVGGANASGQMQTFEELGVFLDKTNTAYVQYAVTAPEDGEYTLGVGFLVGTNGFGDQITETPFTTVLVNDKAYKAPFRGNVRQPYEAVIRVSMKKGLNIIRCTTLTTDQQAWQVDHDNENYPDIWCWINQDYLILDRRLTVVQDQQTASVQAGDKKRMTYNLYEADGEGGLHWGRIDGVKKSRPYIDGLGIGDLYRIPYITFDIRVPADGYYDMSIVTNVCDDMNVENVGYGGVCHMAILVDGHRSTLSFRTLSGRDVIDASGYYTKGKHTVIVTTPLPRTAEEAQSFDYDWTDFLAVEMRGGMTIDTEYVVYEAEDYVWMNLCEEGTGESPLLSNGRVAGNASYNQGLTAARYMEQGAELTETSLVEWRIEAAEAGDYRFLIDIQQGKWGETENFKDAYFIVECNGKRQKITHYIEGNMAGYTRTPVDLSLKKGVNSIRMTFFTGDTSAEAGSVWNDFDALEVEKEQAWKLRFLKAAESYVTLEAEKYAMTNLCLTTENENYSGGALVGSAKYANAQTAAQITRNGLDARKTAYLELEIQAAVAGEYRFLFGIKQGKWGGADQFRNAYTIVECNGKISSYQRPVAGSLPLDGRVAAVLPLSKGNNIIRMTLCTGDTVLTDNGGAVWVDCDTIELDREAAKNLTFQAVSGVVEAESQEFDCYVRMMNKDCSNGYYLGSADYGFVEENGYTFDVLTADNISDMPYVKYVVEADHAGDYRIGLRFNGGTDSFTAAELKEIDEITFAMAVNEGEPQKVAFAPDTYSFNMMRLMDVELEEGENTILVTCTTAELLKNVYNNQSEDYSHYWIDHDAMLLPQGLHGLSSEKLLGIESTNITDPQLIVHQGTGGRTENAGSSGVEAEQSRKNQRIWVVAVLGGGAFVAAGGGLVLWKKRSLFRRKKETGQ